MFFDYAGYPDFGLNNALWGMYQFWAYNLLIIGSCHFLKTQHIENWDHRRIANITGIIALSTFVGFHLIALILALPDFDFRTQAFSQLVYFGDIPAALSVYSFLIPSFMSLPFIIHRTFTLLPLGVNRINLLVSIFGSVMMLFLGMTTVTNEPVDHGIFVNPMFISYVVIILIFSRYSQVDTKLSRTLKRLGYLTLFIFIVFTIIGLFGPPILEQLFFTGFISFWFLYFGIKSNTFIEQKMKLSIGTS